MLELRSVGNIQQTQNHMGFWKMVTSVTADRERWDDPTLYGGQDP